MTDRLNELIRHYITSRRTAGDKIFRTNAYYLVDITTKLGIDNSLGKDELCKQIITILITEYNFFGEYSTGVINAFLKLVENTNKGSIPDSLKLDDLVKVIPINRDIAEILHEMGDPGYYLVYQSDINRFNTKSYLQKLAERAMEIEQQNSVNQHPEEEQQPEEQLIQSTEEQLMQRIEQRQQQIQEQQAINRKNNTRNQNFSTDKMEQPIRSRSKIGMDKLADIVLGLQRDFKRVANALSVQGAQEIVNSHNGKSPNNPWYVTNDDVNDDGIPDIIIRNANNDPIVVNGWTTKGSDYPERFLYYNAYPTREQRKQHPYPAYKRNELYQIKYDTGNVDVHKRGDVTGYNQQPFPKEWKLDNYNVNRNPGKRLSAYRRFQELIVNPVLIKIVIPTLVDNGDIELNGQGKWPERMKHTARVTASLWDYYIIRIVLNRMGIDSAESKQFRKFKNSEQGKQMIDNLVTEFYYHLYHINGDQWTEKQRDDLQQEFLRIASDELLKSILHTAQLAENQHHYPNYHEENVQPFNPETEGEFGKPWGT